ncbi:MAG TPA: ATP-grasp domain-containing protein, partial [Ignavibacteria bacterium]|nr:ATP-grasp domain-containing protein [Ignavibacteria bacterium]
MKNILLVGNGGREHAIAHSIYNSKSFRKGESKIYCTLGSGGLDKFCEPIEIKPTEIQELKEFALDNEIDFTVVGPEVPLSMGIVDEFEKAGLKIFGPNKKAAQIESSKIFAKDLMMRNNIPTAKYKKFGCNDAAAAMKYLDGVNFPVVIKADGLAAGKGVVVCNSRDEAVNTIDMFTKSKVFGSASDNFIIEEFLTGFEVSVLAVTDGEFFVMLPASQDHKRIGDGDTGPNTGGMG